MASDADAETTTTTASSSADGTPEVLVTLGDAMLYSKDLKLLESSGWLNDHCVLFWQQYLELEKFPHAKEKGAFMLQPAAAFSMQFLDKEDLLVDTPDNVFGKLAKASLVLVPVVNDADAENGGGSHWTLVVAHRGEGYFHFDSSLCSAGGMIPEAAKATCAKLASLFPDASIDPANIKTVPCPQQDNGHDCGVFVCGFAEAILDAFMASKNSSSGEDDFSVQKLVPHLPSDMNVKREEMQSVAENRRQSA
ncbi:Sentrin-specific protease [Hondaea fermentalgiana]|uniref:Sentrin-specific protease n=1 Tax=Hondaea fermentalgiana TaxID=2315210 RepID=A0A2R5GBV6_9STRA|nr:Sentrin-specific protease [Hondaea fermentalgiana]|eukprot:GBG27819.1 Sentrin-specific protease [Hondaea fermentalgiana]